MLGPVVRIVYLDKSESRTTEGYKSMVLNGVCNYLPRKPTQAQNLTP